MILGCIIDELLFAIRESTPARTISTFMQPSAVTSIRPELKAEVNPTVPTQSFVPNKIEGL